MRVIADIECNALHNPTEVWLIVCKDLDTSTYHIFRNVTKDIDELKRFQSFAGGVSLWVGHNWLGYDGIHLNRLCNVQVNDPTRVIDTLILSKLIDYPRKGHSVEDYGLEFGIEKGKFSDWSKYSKEMEEYCIRDVDITERIYLKYKGYLSKKEHKASILLEHRFQLLCNTLESNGFAFNEAKAKVLLEKVENSLGVLDKDILSSIKPRNKVIKVVTPKATKFNTISLTSIPKVLRQDIQYMSIDAPFTYFKTETFNPSSHKQIIQLLNDSGWKPVNKTKTHIDTEREYNQANRLRQRTPELDVRINLLHTKLQSLKITGWKVDEENLETLPDSAPKPARLLSQRILLEARRRTLTEWLELVRDGRIHGRFYGLGAWTHRMAHQNPNTANIPNEFDTAGKKKLYGKELRSLWIAPKNRLLVGVDAEGIQLRIFAHYINDPEFTDALVKGKKDDKTDPHSLNQRILGSVCKSRAAAKRFIYALLLGAGNNKLSEILGCTIPETQEALERLIVRYTGWATLKEEVFPTDAKRGWFSGLDGRRVRIPGDTEGNRRHLAMSGYLQNGEAVCMKLATLKWASCLGSKDSRLVNFVHDEWQVECRNNVSEALDIAKIMANSLKEVGEDLNLNCPLAGSYYNDDLKDYTIGTNWSVTH